MKFSTRLLAFGVSIMLTSVSAAGFASVSPQSAESNTKKLKVDSIELNGNVYDRLTSRELPHAIVEILRPDSSVITSKKIGWDYGVDQVSSYYSINIPKIEGNYIIKVSKPGYETKYVPYVLSKLHKRDDNREAPKIYLSPEKVKTLDEFTVKASKIKFYHKGDTLVYQ